MVSWVVLLLECQRSIKLQQQTDLFESNKRLLKRMIKLL